MIPLPLVLAGPMLQHMGTALVSVWVVLREQCLEQQARFGAAGASALRRLSTTRYRTARVGPQLVKEGWSLVDTTDLSVLAVPGREAGQPMAYAEAAEALRHLHQEDPVRARGLKILRLSEVQGATADPA